MFDLVAILCSGQGRQHSAMFDLLADCPEAEPIFAVAGGILGKDPRRFVREAAPADLFSDSSARSYAARRLWLCGRRLDRCGRRAP